MFPFILRRYDVTKIRFSLSACLAIAMMFAVLTPKHASAGPARMEEDRGSATLSAQAINASLELSTTPPVDLSVTTDFVKPGAKGTIIIG
jgi:hypothetical protein